MKKILFVFTWLVLLVFTSCTSSRKYASYESRDSSYVIDIPEEYIFQQEDDNLILWKDCDNFISVRKNYITDKRDFVPFVTRDVRELAARFDVELERDSNDSIRHYTAKSMTLCKHDVYFLKERETATYVIEVSGEDMETAQKIASSFKEANLPTVQKDKDKLIFKKEGFTISKEYNLRFYTEYANQMQELDDPNKAKLIGTYYCLQDKEKPETATLININVFDISNQPKKGRLDSYIEQLNAAGIENKKVKFESCDAVAYSYRQDMGGSYVPTKALYVIRNNRYYLIQVTTQKDVDLKFDKLQKSINFIK